MVEDAEDKAARDGTLRGDVDAGLRFAHLMGEHTRQEVFETAVSVLALLEELAGRGMVDEGAVAALAATEAPKEKERTKEYLNVLMEFPVDKYQLTDLPEIDCASLMHLCRGRCCTLHFKLSEQDLDERIVKWDYSRPYIIRQGGDGYCVHNDRATHFCTIYENRPGVCRTYECRKDKRIWVDFDKKIPAVDPSLEPRHAPVPHGDPPR